MSQLTGKSFYMKAPTVNEIVDVNCARKPNLALEWVARIREKEEKKWNFILIRGNGIWSVK